METNVADLRYFKLWILLDQIIWVWNIKGLQHQVPKILKFKYLILSQRLNSFGRILNQKKMTKNIPIHLFARRELHTYIVGCQKWQILSHFHLKWMLCWVLLNRCIEILNLQPVAWELIYHVKLYSDSMPHKTVHYVYPACI